MSTSWKEKAGVVALVLAFPVLIGLGILIHQLQQDKAARRRLAELDEAEREAGCD
jgi:hypothetical protein